MKKMIKFKMTVRNYRGEKIDQEIGRNAEKEAGAEEGTVDGRVKLIRPEYLAPVVKAQSDLRGYVYTNSLSVSDDGWRAVPADKWAVIKSRVNELADKYKATARASIIDRKDEIESDNALRMGTLHGRHRLPADLASRYDVSISERSLESIPVLDGLEKDLADSITAQCKREHDGIIKGMQDELTGRLAEVCGEIIKRVDGASDKTKFGSLLTVVSNNIQTLRLLDIDGSLSDKLDKLANMIDGKTHAILQANRKERESLKQGVSDIMATLSGVAVQNVQAEVKQEPKAKAKKVTVQAVEQTAPAPEQGMSLLDALIAGRL